MKKVQKMAVTTLVVIALASCSQQPAGVSIKPVTEVASVSKELAKEVKEGEGESIGFKVQGWKEKAVGVGISFVAEKAGGFVKDYAFAVYGAYDAKKQLKAAQEDLRRRCSAGVKYPKNCPK